MKKLKLSFMFTVMLVFFMSTIICFADETFVRGTLNGSTYENPTLGIRCDLPDVFVMATEEEIEQITTTGMETIYKEDEKGQQILDVSKITLVYEMLAVSSTDGSTVQILAEKPMLSNMTLDQYINANIRQIGELPMEISEPETGKEDFCGNELDYLLYSINYEGVSIQQKMFFTESGDRFVIFQFSALDMDSLETMQGYFSEYHGE